MIQKKLVETLHSLVPSESVIGSRIDKVKLFNTTDSFGRTPMLYEACIIILVQGGKRIYLGNEVFEYDPLHYLVLPVPLPIECEANIAPDKPLLGINIEVNPAIVGEIVLDMEATLEKSKPTPKGIYSAPLSESLLDVTARLVNALTSENESRILGPMLVRELIFRVLSEEETGALRSLAYRDRHFYQIAQVLERIHKSYGEMLGLNELAADAGMSISTFHSAFKAVTSISPLQYIKNVRLHKARQLMLQDGEYVYEAASRVGYESTSQFSREYKRLFGIPPGKDAVSA